MFRPAAIRLKSASIASWNSLANARSRASTRIALHSKNKPPFLHIARAFSGTRPRYWHEGAKLARVALGIGPDDHHLVMIYYYEGSAVHKLDVTLPEGLDLSPCAVRDTLHVYCGDTPLAELLMERLDDMPPKKGKKLCLEIVKLCGEGQIRAMYDVSDADDWAPWILKVEVGNQKDWAANRYRPYEEGTEVLKDDLGGSMLIRLCEGGHVSLDDD